MFDAVARAKVPALIYASSVGAYSPGPKDRVIDEGWPTGGVDTLFYSRHKAQVERILDTFEAEHPDTRVVRMRTGLTFKREAAVGQRRLFAGPLFPGFLARPSLIPFVPDVHGLRFQVLHSKDAGAAYALAIVKDVRGAFNVAAEPIIDSSQLARILEARLVRVPVPLSLVRALVDSTWRLHLQPSPPGWLDLALGVPVMDTSRARELLGWAPRYQAGEILMELLEGLRTAEGFDTPPLSAATSGPARIRELVTGIGHRSGL